jgi:hypothetical protein
LTGVRLPKDGPFVRVQGVGLETERSAVVAKYLGILKRTFSGIVHDGLNLKIGKQKEHLDGLVAENAVR